MTYFSKKFNLGFMTITKLLTTIILAFLTSLHCLGQQQPLHGLFFKNYSIYNPAHTGDRHKLYTNLQFRAQWVDLPSNLNSGNGLVDFRIDPDHHSIGAAFTFEDLGFEKTQKINLNYSYSTTIGGNRLSFGIAPTLKFAEVQNGWVIVDPQQSFVPTQLVNVNIFDLNSGIAYTSDLISTGIGIVNLLGNSDQNYYNERHLYSHFDYKFIMGNSYSLTTRYYLRTDFNFLQHELNLVNTFSDTYLLGISYRTGVHYGASIGAMAGVRLFDIIEANYQFEYHPSSFISPGSSHEIGLTLYLD
jgi:type IX secretion system PorP/SprF family membrane protein